MWKRALALVVALGFIAGGVSTSASASTSSDKAARHEVEKYWSAWLKHPDSYTAFEVVLTLYHWPTAQSMFLAHKLAYEIQSDENGDNRSGDWRVTYLLLLSALGETNPLS